MAYGYWKYLRDEERSRKPLNLDQLVAKVEDVSLKYFYPSLAKLAGGQREQLVPL